MKKRRKENSNFICVVCKSEIKALSNGSYRNHCPICLHSLHVDLYKPGDRLSDCHGIMEPIRLVYHSKKGQQLIHRCKTCGKESVNKVAIDDPVQPDDINKICEISKNNTL